MKKHMDQDVDEIARVLLHKTGDCSEFIQKAADRSLGIMVRSVTPMRAMAALMAGGVKYVTLPLSELCNLTTCFVGNENGEEEGIPSALWYFTAATHLHLPLSGHHIVMTYLLAQSINIAQMLW